VVPFWKECMVDLISQDDLDLLWGQKTDIKEDKVEEVKGKETSTSVETSTSSGVSQADLDALWAGLGGTDDVAAATTATPVKEEPTPSNSISQADLDALWGALGTSEETAPEKKEEPAIQGISQDDLNALWGGLETNQSTPAKAVAAPSAVAGMSTDAEPSKVSEHLSQDDIDRLLEEMLG
jgi:hypothetical protein